LKIFSTEFCDVGSAAPSYINTFSVAGLIH